jgi:hypothetical protein
MTVCVSAQVPVITRGFNDPGNILIADQFNNRVIEVKPDGKIVWQFGLGPNDFSPQSIIGCNDAQRVGPFTLMSGTGTPRVSFRRHPTARRIIASSWLTRSATSCGSTASSARRAMALTC